LHDAIYGNHGTDDNLPHGSLGIVYWGFFGMPLGLDFSIATDLSGFLLHCGR